MKVCELIERLKLLHPLDDLKIVSWNEKSNYNDITEIRTIKGISDNFGIADLVVMEKFQ